MSLRRRIAAAATLAAAVVAIAVGATGYLSTRSHLIGQLRQELRTRAAPYQHGHPPGDQPAGGGGSGAGGAGGASSTQPRRSRIGVPQAPALGGAPGYFQSVSANGTAVAGDGGKPELPVGPRVVQIARDGHGSFYRSATVRGIRVEILTVANHVDHTAVQVALPLTEVDSVLSSLLETYALLVGGGVLLAGLLGTLIARSALAPITRFSERTEQVADTLASPQRLEETGASELRRLATSFNRTLDALERSIQAQQHLIADASHELRTPMAALRSNIQIFLESHRLPADERAGLQQAILDELDELTQLVADVVELARGSAPNEHTEPIALDEIVDRVVDRARRRSPEIEFAVELEPTVIVNVAERVGRAVTNVIDNARKWSPATATVEVGLRDGLLTVRDHGPGFAAADLPYVFDRFYRAEGARRMPGSGLGLAIVKHAAEAHGGLVVAANAVGGGAQLQVSFGPVAELGGARPQPLGSQPATN